MFFFTLIIHIVINFKIFINEILNTALTLKWKRAKSSMEFVVFLFVFFIFHNSNDGYLNLAHLHLNTVRKRRWTNQYLIYNKKFPIVLLLFFIQMRLYPPGSETPYNGTKLVKFNIIDDDIRQRMTKTNQIPDANLLKT